MADIRPTLQSAAWAMTGFLDAAEAVLRTDRTSTELRLYFYAVTQAGWRELRDLFRVWLRLVPRPATAYIGTDHALTESDALATMRDDGVSVRLLRRYNGVYHPKVMWFVAGAGGQLLVGSNNLTLDGLKSNIEFATLTQLVQPDAILNNWHAAVHAASDPLSDELLDNYANERQQFGEARARARVAATFTWSRRSSAVVPRREGAGRTIERTAPTTPAAPMAPRVASVGDPVLGDLVVEIMPLETGTGGSQIQIPMAAADSFFRLGSDVGDQISVVLNNITTGDDRTLTMTRFANRTARLVIKELDYRDRPCVVVFRRAGRRRFDFEIVRRAIDPDRYRSLIDRCGPPTREGSRRWAIVR